MSFQKTLVDAGGAKVDASESAGVVSLTGSLTEKLGGGEAAGVVSLQAQFGVQISAVQLANLLFELIESKSPAGVVLIEKEVQAAAIAALQSA